MGALHEGHLNLMRAARRECDEVVVSIFVNPTQFGKNEDFSKYPRDLERDARMAESVGVDLLLYPSVEEIYTRETTVVHVPEVTDRWEGQFRPGHFDGVATVVLKLFNIVRPRIAYFGWKDLQQCVVIKRMTEDLNANVELRYQETTRESDGLAMSSRNAYLSSSERAIAPELHRSLAAIIEDVTMRSQDLSHCLAQQRQKLNSFGFDIEYLEAVDLDSLEPILALKPGSAIIVAARLGATRLIDNLRM